MFKDSYLSFGFNLLGCVLYSSFCFRVRLRNQQIIDFNQFANFSDCSYKTLLTGFFSIVDCPFLFLLAMWKLFLEEVCTKIMWMGFSWPIHIDPLVLGFRNLQ